MQRPVISVIIAVLAIVIIAVIVFFWQQCTSDTSESGWGQGSWGCGVWSGQQPSQPSAGGTPLGP